MIHTTDNEKLEARMTNQSIVPRKITLSGMIHAQEAHERRRYEAGLLTAGELQGWGLTISPDVLAASLHHFQGKTVFLDHANWFESPKLDKLLGVTTNAMLTDDTITAEIMLHDTPTAAWFSRVIDEILQAQEGGEPAADIGMSAVCWIAVADETDDDGLYPIEAIHDVESVDVVFRPASDGARFRRILAQAGNHPPILQEVNEMSEQLNTKPPEVVEAGPPAPMPQIFDPAPYQTALAEAVLQAKLATCALPEAMRNVVLSRHVDRISTPAEIDATIQEQRTLLATLQADQVITGFGQPIDAGQMTDPLDMARQAVYWLFGVTGAKAPDPQLRSASAIYQALTGDISWHGKFDSRHARFARASTATLADMATDATNVIVTEQWEALAAYRWFEPLVTVAPHDGSLNSMNWVSFGGLANLPVVAEGGTYTEANVADAKENDVFVKYGVYVGITEEMFRKNQMMKIQAIPRALAAAAVRTRSYYISYIFSQAAGLGPTLDNDTTALFDASHNNYATTSFSTDPVAAWKAARLAMFEQTQLGSSKPMGLYPRYCLLPGELYETGLELFGYGAGPGGLPFITDNTVSVYAVSRGPADLRPEVIVVPDWSDANNWYYLADPNLCPCLFMAYAQNSGGRSHPMPEIFSVTSPTAGLIFTNDTLPIKVRDWFAYGVSDYRGVGGRVVA